MKKRLMSNESMTSELTAEELEKLAAEHPWQEPWDGFDLDKTTATLDDWQGLFYIGDPIPAMIDRIKQTLASGRKAKIFTARVSYSDERINAAVRKVIQAWCVEHIGQALEVTNIKDMGMRNLYDDRAFHVIPNTGIVVSG